MRKFGNFNPIAPKQYVVSLQKDSPEVGNSLVLELQLRVTSIALQCIPRAVGS